jgi:formate dehydrogenase subunit beta
MMSPPRKLAVNEQDVLGALRTFFQSILALEDIHAILVPRRQSVTSVVMPSLISDPRFLQDVDPLAPAFFLNAARMVSRLSRKSPGHTIAVVLRPCEIRAFVELVKLKQGSRDDIVIIGLDCLGAYSNKDYRRYAAESPESGTLQFFYKTIDGVEEVMGGIGRTTACNACERPFPIGADIAVGFLGISPMDHFLVYGQSPKGEEILFRLNLMQTEEPASRKEAVESLVAARFHARDQIVDRTREATNSLEKLTAYLAGCVNCYNCRVACPVCYCRECVFTTDVFDHDPFQYLQWAQRNGEIKMPTDTVFYHLTRLVHISTACVGCGQCSNACPSEIPLAELFRATAIRTQRAFDYEAGMDPDSPPPMTVFREQEFSEVVGLSE